MFAKTLSVPIQLSPANVYEYVANPENLPQWATAFIRSVRKSPEGDWLADTPDGSIAIRFVPRNEYGVLDHYVRVSPGQEVLNPMRVLANGTGSEVIFTVFQSDGMSDEQFFKDAAMVERDLHTLKTVLEQANSKQ